MESEQLLSFIALGLLLGMAAWFTIKARTHFSAESPRTPILFSLEALSLAIMVGTLAIVILGPIRPALPIVASIVLACAAGLLFRSALRATRKKDFGVVFGRTVPYSVVQDGPYRLIRHPLYTAYTLNWLGCAVLSGSLLIGLAVGAVALLYVVAARAEESDLLQSSLGPAYAEYKSRTGLLVPRLRR